MNFQLKVLLLSFVVSVILGAIIIPILRKLKVGQIERTDGPQSHLQKQGTPTMGGIIMALTMLLISGFLYWEYMKTEPDVATRMIPLVFVTLGFGLVGFVDDFKKLVLKNTAEGIGLLRSEFLYMDSEEMPTEEEQFNSYKEVAEKMQGKQVIIRTLDVGGDKEIKYLKMEKEANPFLGYRAIRLCLDNPEIFKPQIRALLRASAYGNIAIMFPMISSIEELRRAKAVVEECKKELDNEGKEYKKDIKTGIMVEIPSVAIIAEEIAKECDFFSIGTNDLIQYTVAVERGNEKISNLYSKYHPAVIRLIKSSIDGAHKAGIFCGMCGEAAGDELLIPLLVGLGLDEFSMNPNKILNSRKIVNMLDKKECETLAEEILKLGTTSEVEEKLKEFMNK